MDRITVTGARQNNLKNIDLELPRGSLVVVTGVSGSGKSSLVFDTLYQESRRRFLETLPTYVLQFMERIPRPDFDRIEGLSPAVAVEQRNPVNTSRSTVGTITEILDYLRLLFSRAGTTYCPDCGNAVVPDTPDAVSDRVLAGHSGHAASVAFAPPRSALVNPGALRESLLALGFIHAWRGADLASLRLDEPSALEGLTPEEPLLVAVDRLRLDSASRGRLDEALRQGYHHGEGRAAVIVEGQDAPLRFSAHYHCAVCDRSFPEPTHNLFSFNNPYGACPLCRGFGNLLDYDLGLIVPDRARTLAEGALDPWTKPRYEGRREALRTFCLESGIDMHVRWDSLSETQRRMLLEGEGWFEGLLPFLRKLEAKKYKQYIRFFLRSYQSERVCPSCNGSRLRPEAAFVRVEGRTFGELLAEDVDCLGRFIASLPARLPSSRLAAAGELVREIGFRLDFMRRVGLGYLSLGRMTKTLSGGEYQRIMLTRLLGSGLTDTLYVLDEPTIGLHPRDTDRLISVLLELVAAGNSLLVVEHDRSVIKAAAHLIELGPGAGEQGGQVLFNGPAQGLAGMDTPTGRWLSGPAASGARRTRPAKRFVGLRGARLNNLRGIDVSFPVGCFTCVTGVSGSGKSSLVTGLLHPALEAALDRSAQPAASLPLDSLEQPHYLSGVTLVDQSPIGRTPRSNPVTYVKAYDEIRKLFAGTKQAQSLGLSAGDFSFNTAGGRCETCSGAGFERIEMQFMADIFVPCETCGGKRFSPRVLRVKYNGATLDRVLEMTVNEAIEFFGAETGIGKPLWVLQSVGLGYLRLGQSATTLSGGESQRLKIARQLCEPASAARGRGRMYILDEPTTGLHHQDTQRLLRVLDRLVDAGHSLVVIEHNPEVIARADWIVDLGPEGGSDGGELLVQGTPRQVAACERSRTGAVLRGILGSRIESEFEPGD